MNKKTQMLLPTNSLDYDCISIIETWLHSTHKNEEFIDNKYNVFRKDRYLSDIEAERGGGVMLAIDKKYDSRSIEVPEMEPIEAVCVHISLPSSFLYIYSLYIQNRFHTSTERELTKARYNNHIMAIKAINALCNTNDFLVILGDFNMPLVGCINDDETSDNEYGFVTVLGNSNATDAKIYREFTSECLEIGLHQMCNLKNHANNVLDSVYTNVPELMSVDKASMTLFTDEFRDPAHNPIVCTIECEPCQFNSDSSSARYCFKKANYEEMNKELAGLNLDELINHSDINSMTESFYNTLFDIIGRHVPQATPKNNNIPVWFDRKLLNLRNIRNREYKKLQTKRIMDKEADDIKFESAKLEFITYQKELYTSYVKKLASERKGDPKSFWRYINGKRFSNSLPSKLNYRGSSATTESEKANLFAEFFASVYTNHITNIDLNEITNGRSDIGFNKLNITNDAVFNAAYRVDTTKGAGDDKIPPIFIRYCTESLTKPLTIIYQRSIVECEYPDRWKTGRITPIFKSGSKTEVNNNRGVTVLSMFAKLFETLVYNQLKLVIYPRLSKSQHGFVPNRNTSTNLAELTTFIHRAFENNSKLTFFTPT